MPTPAHRHRATPPEEPKRPAAGRTFRIALILAPLCIIAAVLSVAAGDTSRALAEAGHSSSLTCAAGSVKSSASKTGCSKPVARNPHICVSNAACPLVSTSSKTKKPAIGSSGTSAQPAFATRPKTTAITCSGKSNVTISGYTFSGIGNDQPSITIRKCTNVTISNNDFLNDAEPIYVVGSTNVRITNNRYRNITGPHERNGSHRGNFTQWENSFGGSISGNVGVGGDTEDIVSIYKSGGTSAAHPLVIEKNVFEGTNWSSSSGSGILLGDGGGSHVIVRNNTLVNAGQVGIGVAGGSDIHVTGNTVLGEARPLSNVGIYVWGQSGVCSNIEVGRNTIEFKKPDGTNSPLYDGGGCGSVTGWMTNMFSTKLHAASLRPNF